jgi:hypothetical protein
MSANLICLDLLLSGHFKICCMNRMTLIDRRTFNIRVTYCLSHLSSSVVKGSNLHSPEWMRRVCYSRVENTIRAVIEISAHPTFVAWPTDVLDLDESLSHLSRVQRNAENSLQDMRYI